MKKIALALILFQLIGCAKQPVVITHPESKQEHEQEQKTPQGDTPQAPKTNYLKIGGAIVGILTILASIGLIAYCCSRKGKESVTLTAEQVQAKKIAEQDKQDIDNIVTKTAEELQNNYPNSREFILDVSKTLPEYNGNVELQAILRWYFLQKPRTPNWEIPGETNLCRQRDIVTTDLNNEVEEKRQANPNMPMSEVFTNIEGYQSCFIQTEMRNMAIYERAAQWRTLGVLMAPYVINTIVRIVYYYELKDSLIRNSEKQGERR